MKYPILLILLIFIYDIKFVKLEGVLLLFLEHMLSSTFSMYLR